MSKYLASPVQLTAQQYIKLAEFRGWVHHKDVNMWTDGLAGKFYDFNTMCALLDIPRLVPSGSTFRFKAFNIKKAALDAIDEAIKRVEETHEMALLLNGHPYFEKLFEPAHKGLQTAREIIQDLD